MYHISPHMLPFLASSRTGSILDARGAALVRCTFRHQAQQQVFQMLESVTAELLEILESPNFHDLQMKQGLQQGSRDSAPTASSAMRNNAVPDLKV